MASQGTRELVYCHNCQEEWYRDEHGIICPHCQSDFTEIIELDHDPRGDHLHNALNVSGGLFPSHPHLHQEPQHQSPLDGAPDPDEDDINHLHWQETGPNSFTVRGNYHHTNSGLARDGNDGQPSPSAPPTNDAGGLLGSLLSMIQSLTGPSITAQDQGPRQIRTEFPGGHATVTYNTTIAVHPRDPNGPQPHEPPVEDLNNILGQLFADLHHQHLPPGHPASRSPFGVLPALLMNMNGLQSGRLGDAVLSQEAFDRVMSQLMEQNTAGNAPGPATAEEIASLPKKQVDSPMLGEQGKAECSICMDSVALGDEVTELYCHHWFHTACVSAWLQEHDTCPHCRLGTAEAKRIFEERTRSTDMSGSAGSKDFDDGRKRRADGS